jgi:solute carrier family 10 (sodium/bile acid cotransporter), member 7
LVRFLTQRWFLIALVLLFLLGSLLWRRLLWVASDETAIARDAIVAAVLFLMALPVEARAMWQAVRKPLAPLLAIGIGCVVLPLVAWGLSPLMSAELAGGFLIAASIPCTLASAAVWTRQAGGNDSIAVLVTIITNSLCFLITPFWLALMLGSRADASSLDAVELIVKLFWIVVLPIALAQIVRLRKEVAGFAAEHKKTLGVLTQCGILSFVFTGAVQTGERLSGANGARMLVADLAVMIACTVGLHTSMLFLGIGLSRLLGLPRGDGIAVGLAGSQKTLMVGLGIAVDSGFSVLPIIAYHIGQLLIDTVVADHYRLRQQRDAETSRQAA